MKKAIVTGANGFVGKALVKELCAHGVYVFAVMRQENCLNEFEQESNVTPILCNMEEIYRLPEVIEDTADVWYQLVWAGASGNLRADYSTQLKNIDWMLASVRAAKEMGCTRFIGAGTLAELDSLVLGSINGGKLKPASCYGIAKLAAHYMSKAECSRLQMEHVWACLANVYGPGDRTSNFINTTLQKFLSGAASDFTQAVHTYDFIYIDDAAQGLYCVGNAGYSNYNYYVGSANARPLREYIEQMHDLTNSDSIIRFGTVPFDGAIQPDEVFDCKSLMIDTGYAPKFTFEEGIQKTISAMTQKKVVEKSD